MRTRTELWQCVVEAIHIATLLDKKIISEESWLIGDLGIESIDFLDISFELEQRVKVGVDFQEVFRIAQELRGDSVKDVRVQDVLDFLEKHTAGRRDEKE